jgi:hypothetical protein
MTEKTPKEKILHHMRMFGAISKGEALDLYRCLNLRAVIAELKEEGTGIITRIATNTDSGTPYKIHYLEEFLNGKPT